MRSSLRQLGLLSAAWLGGAALVMATAVDAAPAKKAQGSTRAERPAAVHEKPVKRQNFRARRPDEIPPWEGFEDCPLGFPCVGIVGSHGRWH